MGQIISFTRTKGKKENKMEQCREVMREVRSLVGQGRWQDVPDFLAKKGYIENNNRAKKIIEFARFLGFKVFQKNLELPERIYGMIAVDKKYEEKFGTDKIIILDEQDSYYHKRFVVAHELGHYLLHYEENGTLYETYRGSSAHGDEREQEANKFAAALLMPAEEFRNVSNLYDGDVGALSTLFEVPEEAVRRRFKEVTT